MTFHTINKSISFKIKILHKTNKKEKKTCLIQTNSLNKGCQFSKDTINLTNEPHQNTPPNLLNMTVYKTLFTMYFFMKFLFIILQNTIIFATLKFLYHFLIILMH